VWVSGRYAYLANWTNGMVIVDVSNPQSPSRAGARAPSGYAGSLGMEDSVVYVGTGSRSVEAINVADPDSAWSYGAVNTSGNPISIHAAGGYAYVVDDSRGLLIYHLAPPPAAEKPASNSWTGLVLEQNGPCLRFDAGPARSGRVAVFNLAGQKVFSRTVYGQGSFRWDAESRPGGMYIGRLAVGGRALTKKMILMR